MIKNNLMHCLTFNNDGSNICPKIGISVLNNNKLNCLNGAGFTNTSNPNSFGYFIINSCNYDINTTLNIPNINKDITFKYYTYQYNMPSPNSNPFSKFYNCGSNNIWECGPVNPDTTTLEISLNDPILHVPIKGFSIIIGNTM